MAMSVKNLAVHVCVCVFFFCNAPGIERCVLFPAPSIDVSFLVEKLVETSLLVRLRNGFRGEAGFPAGILIV